MPSPTFADIPPSRFTLGTVQFGLPYGIANRTGQPSYEEVRAMIARAWERGVSVLDTASAYGESEQTIGRALADLELLERMRVVTKVAPLPAGLAPADAAKRIEESVVQSLRRLHLETVPLALIHHERNIEYIDGLLALKDRGLIQAAGVSFVRPLAAQRALGTPGVQGWQITASLLDRRFTDRGIASAARGRGIAVFARSIYLQGLLLMDDAATPPHLTDVAGPRRRIREIASAHGLTLQELAIRGVLALPGIQSLVMGVDTLAQLDQNLDIVDAGPPPAGALAELQAYRPELADDLLQPSDWEQRRSKLAAH